MPSKIIFFFVFCIGAISLFSFVLVLYSNDLNNFHYQNLQNGWVFSKNSLPDNFSIEKEYFLNILRRIDPLIYFLVFLSSFSILMIFEKNKNNNA